ncbi:MAG: UDP-N-acetylmuramoyl-L-alanine--D-glutamate ligase [Elusimicrobia bacterium]|nr:UDP-N-acetylmuramoyl-L-alanine--D-glutamate ligase [Elusimicrobiota bacterium]
MKKMAKKAPKKAKTARPRKPKAPPPSAAPKASEAALPRDSARSDRFLPAVWKRGPAAVLGMGRSGLAAAKLLAKKGFKVLLSDERPRKALRAAAAKLPAGVSWEGGGHSDRLLKCRFAVKSPGLPSHAPVLERLKAAGIPVFSELEVALAFLPAVETVAVTGTNGKTTTATLTAAVFKAARRRVHLLGNVGVPVCAAVAGVKKGDLLVLETSSYQLEDSRRFLPEAAAILNLTPDHLDHHGGMEAYAAAKRRVFAWMDRRHSCVFNADDAGVVAMARSCRGRKLFFGRSPSTMTAAWPEGGKILLRLQGWKKPVKLSPPKLPGEHNLQNAMAAALLGAARGVKPEAIQKAFKAFKGVSHRLEDCGVRKGLACVNDSKATNVDSTLVALATMPQTKTTLLILGGRPKAGGFAGLRSQVERRVKAVLSVGEAAARVETDLQGAAHVFPCQTLEKAVEVAFQIGLKGETLLLSPACASFDQFTDYEHRGRTFKELLAVHGGKPK